MTVTRSDAAGALRDIEQAQTRAGEMRGYRHAAPYLIGWGLIWAVGYTLMAVRPQPEWGWIWLPLDAAGIIGSILQGRSDNRGGTQAVANCGMRILLGVLFTALFMAATYVLFAPATVAPFIVFPGLIAGAIYVAIGLAWLPRMGWIGFGIFVLSMAGYLFFREWLLYWMAAVCGGGLMLSGLWLRNA